MPRVYCFEPIEDSAATALVLGSMPGKVSLATGQYYAHSRNAFWTIMGELVGAHFSLPYPDRIGILRSSGIALWDVLASCVRSGSLDSDIQTGSIIPNDFNAFFLGHPHISRIYFNGVKSEQCFLKYVHPHLEPTTLQYRRLPSTSPANAGVSYAQKLQAWQSVMSKTE